MKALHAANLCARKPSYIFGRFYVCRVLFSRWVHFRQRFGVKHVPPLDTVPPSEIICMEPRLAVAAAPRRTALAAVH